MQKKLLLSSRFKDLVKTFNLDEYNNTIKYIDKLILENKEYCDKANYSYLCNIFSSLSLVFMYIDNGKTKEEAIEIVSSAMYKFLEPQIKPIQNLARHRWFVPLFEKVYAT